MYETSVDGTGDVNTELRTMTTSTDEDVADQGVSTVVKTSSSEEDGIKTTKTAVGVGDGVDGSAVEELSTTTTVTSSDEALTTDTEGATVTSTTSDEGTRTT